MNLKSVYPSSKKMALSLRLNLTGYGKTLGTHLPFVLIKMNLCKAIISGHTPKQIPNGKPIPKQGEF